MIQDIIVVDNIFKDPDSVVNFAKTLQYFTQEEHPAEKSYWSGIRSRSISLIDKKIWKDLTGDVIFKSLAHTMGFNKTFTVDVSWDVAMFFHQLREEDKYQDSWYHIDPKLVYAGVVYLDKNPKPNSGTLIIKDDKTKVEIDNVFNRLVLYRSDYYHSALGGYGKTIDDSRLTLTLFFKEIQFSLTHPDNKH